MCFIRELRDNLLRCDSGYEQGSLWRITEDEHWDPKECD